MLSRLALRPDLNECVLEERTLLAAYGIVTPPQFIPVNPFNNMFVLTNGSAGGTGSASGSGYGNINLSPVLTVYNAVLLGMNLTSQASAISSLGGTSLSGNAIFASGLSGVAGVGALQSRVAAMVPSGGGGGGGDAGGTGPTGRNGPTAGYGSVVSSGYNFALSNANNFGMTTTTPVGSVPVHTYGNTDFEVQTPDVRYGATDAAGTSPVMGVGTSGQGPASALIKKLLGNSPGVTNTLINGPVKVSPSP